MASIEATNDQNDNMYKNFLPDESAFNIFFKSMVPNNREMNLEEFMQYKYVKDLLSDGLISQEDIHVSTIMPQTSCLFFNTRVHTHVLVFRL